MNLSDVSKTALVTLRCHVLESRKPRPLIHDPMAGYCLDKLRLYASEAETALLFNKRLSSALTRHIAIRARKYDTEIDNFTVRHPACTVVNLGCGFDTRYWRIDHARCEYIELDLPEIAAMKTEVLGEHLRYELIGSSVLEPSWIDKVTRKGNRHFLLVAEGLLMYLPKVEVMALFKTLAERFVESQMMLEVVADKYTRGLWKKIVALKMRNELGFDAGSSYNFGIRNALELESYAKGIRITNEWSYLEDPELRPRIFRYMGISRTQWTVTASIH